MVFRVGSKCRLTCISRHQKHAGLQAKAQKFVQAGAQIGKSLRRLPGRISALWPGGRRVSGDVKYTLGGIWTRRGKPSTGVFDWELSCGILDGDGQQ
jgi:hypothetical protein